MSLSKKKEFRSDSFGLYLLLAAAFIACLVAGNLIFQKFFFVEPFTFLGGKEDSLLAFIGNYRFELSVGIIPYPLTFLITDIISEIYGRKRANYVVYAGLFATLFVWIIVLLAEWAPATDYSPVDDATFIRVFGLTGVALAASMTAYLIAQLIDIRIYHFWKRYTGGRLLWVRNNFSTLSSQFVDTAVVLLLLCTFGAISWNLFWGLLINGFVFKMLIAFLDTPLLYLSTWLIRRKYKLAMAQEMDFIE